MEIEVLLADGTTKRVRSRSTYFRCPDCRGIPEQMWTWHFFATPPSYDGEYFPQLSLNDYERGSSKEGLVQDGIVIEDAQPLGEYLGHFSDWRIGIEVIQKVASGVISAKQIADTARVFEALNTCVLLMIPIFYAEGDGRIIEEEHWDTLEELHTAMMELSPEPIRREFIPRDTAGICKTHQTLVYESPTPLLTDISDYGILTIRDNDVVVFGSNPGQWTSFYEVAPDPAEG